MCNDVTLLTERLFLRALGTAAFIECYQKKLNDPCYVARHYVSDTKYTFVGQSFNRHVVEAANVLSVRVAVSPQLREDSARRSEPAVSLKLLISV